MGGERYWYFTEFVEDVARSLMLLHKREFEAGRYEPAMAFYPRDESEMRLSFPIDTEAPSPGSAHATIDEAWAAGDATGSGTRSILDITRIDISSSPASDSIEAWNSRAGRNGCAARGKGEVDALCHPLREDGQSARQSWSDGAIPGSRDPPNRELPQRH